MRYRIVETENTSTGCKMYHVEKRILGFWIDELYYRHSAKEAEEDFLADHGTEVERVVAEHDIN
jgi:hypothetical protein